MQTNNPSMRTSMPPEEYQIAGQNVAELRTEQEAIAGEIFGCSTTGHAIPLGDGSEGVPCEKLSRSLKASTGSNGGLDADGSLLNLMALRGSSAMAPAGIYT
jgi:hypothetical protein